MANRYIIIGAGTGQEKHLTAEALSALKAADAVFADRRLAESLRALRPDIHSCAYGDMAVLAAAAPGACAALLVSGDTGFFSAAGMLQKALAPLGDTQILCGLSSMQLLCARVGCAYQDALPVSLHGRAGDVLGAVSYHPKVFVLTGGETRAHTVCRSLMQAGLGHVAVAVGERLGDAQERVVQGSAAELAEAAFDGLSVMLIRNDGCTDPSMPVRDGDLTRGAVPMTKEEVRWVAVSKLGVCPGDTVYDIGAGTGSVAIELARRANRGRVYALEHKPKALALLDENRTRLGAYNMTVVPAAAPGGLDGLPAPDAVFIGGSGGHLTEILHRITALSPSVRVAITAIALETLHESMRALDALQFADVEVMQLSAARGSRVGSYTMMKANNPVYVISGRGAGHA